MSLSNKMASSSKGNALLCPNCRKLISRSVNECPYCNMSNPGSLLKDNPLTRGTGPEKMIRLIIIVNAVMFGLSVLIDFNPRGFSASPFHFLSPSNLSLAVLGATGTRAIFGLHQWWTLVSASFLHGSLLHLLFNMIALYQIGPLVAREFGVNRMVIIYLLSGVLGFLVSVLAGVWSTIGASAAVCGLIGAMLYYGKHRGGTYGQAVYSQIGGWAIGIAVFGFMVPGINNWGHGGGMAAGFLLAMVFGYKERRPDTFSHTIIATASLALTGLILIWSCLRGLLLLIS